MAGRRAEDRSALHRRRLLFRKGTATAARHSGRHRQQLLAGHPGGGVDQPQGAGTDAGAEKERRSDRAELFRLRRQAPALSRRLPGLAEAVRERRHGSYLRECGELEAAEIVPVPHAEERRGGHHPLQAGAFRREELRARPRPGETGIDAILERCRLRGTQTRTGCNREAGELPDSGGAGEIRP